MNNAYKIAEMLKKEGVKDAIIALEMPTHDLLTLANLKGLTVHEPDEFVSFYRIYMIIDGLEFTFRSEERYDVEKKIKQI